MDSLEKTESRPVSARPELYERVTYLADSGVYQWGKYGNASPSSINWPVINGLRKRVHIP
jgi:hypothetical protein